MARFATIDLTKSSGFDDEKQLLVLQTGKTVQLYLVCGEGLNVVSDNPDVVQVVSASEKDIVGAHRSQFGRYEAAEAETAHHTVRLVTLKAGAAVGSAEVRGVLDGMGWAGPVTVRVVQSPDRAQVGRVAGQVTPEFADELRRLTLREAVTRVAEDQLYSAIALKKSFGVYMPANVGAGPADWCGAFAYFCWMQASAIKGVPNPFGANSAVLWSPQRAIGWALRNPDKAVILRYKGGDPGPHPTDAMTEWHEIGWDGHNLARGDIVMVRQVSTVGDPWRHVTQIDWVGESVIHTVDGNQGSGHSIKRRSYDINKKLSNGLPELAFLHILV